MKSLDDRLLDAHTRGAKAELVALYSQAAQGTADINARCFYLTHAYVFALELGHPDAPDLRNQLKVHGRV